MLLKRTITLLVAIPLISAIIYWGSENIFLVIASLTASAALLEYLTFNLTGSTLFTRVLIVIAGVLSIFCVSYYYQHLFTTLNAPIGMDWVPAALIASITIGVFSALIIKILLFPGKLVFQDPFSVSFIGIVYICFSLSYLVLIRYQNDGVGWIFFVLIVLWMGDTGAYIVGSMVGRRKLCPSISPNKTVEGAVAGVLFSLLAGLTCNQLFLTEMTSLHCVILTIAIALTGQLGDLCESVFKRERGVKDSGNLLPGHGGILDRIDSLLFAAPLLYYYKTLLLR